MAAAALSTQAVVGAFASSSNGKTTTTKNKKSSFGEVRGLRAPSDRMALKSAFSNGGNAFSAAVVMPETGSVPPRITMRAASKTAYICKDCG